VISVKIDRKRKVPVTVLLKALGGYSDNDIKDMFVPFDTGEINFIEETLKKDTANNQEEALLEIYQRLRSGEMANPDSARSLSLICFLILKDMIYPK